MPRRPQTSYTNFQRALPQISLDAAAAPARALAGIGKEVSNIGNQLMDWQMRMNEVENFKNEARKKNEWATVYADAQNEMMQMAPEDRRTYWPEKLRELQATLEDESLSQVSRDRLEVAWDNFATKTAIEVERDASLQIVKDARAFGMDSYERFVSEGRYEEAGDLLNQMYERQIIPTDSYLTSKRSLEGQSFQNDILDTVDGFPHESNEFIENPKDGLDAALLKIQNSNFNPDKKRKFESMARKQYEERVSLMIDDLSRDLDSGIIDSVEKAKEKYPHLPNSVYESVGKFLSKAAGPLDPMIVRGLIIEKSTKGFKSEDEKAKARFDFQSMIQLVSSANRLELKNLLNSKIAMSDEEDGEDGVEIPKSAIDWIEKTLYGEMTVAGLFNDPNAPDGTYDIEDENYSNIANSKREEYRAGLTEFVFKEMEKLAKEQKTELTFDNASVLYRRVLSQNAGEILSFTPNKEQMKYFLMQATGANKGVQNLKIQGSKNAQDFLSIPFKQKEQEIPSLSEQEPKKREKPYVPYR